MDLSLGSNNDEESNTGSNISSMEKEYMFDKVVTPSDVGKLNRLVIPKQHAEKYFPLDSTSNAKGLLLNFEDRNGTSWRFRYSYWNSSQSYVMTKGWSRFVKENKLDAGDIVSFQRGVGEVGKDRFYIDWRRRPNVPDPTSFAHIQLQNQLNFSQWGGLYSLPQSYEPLHRLNFSIYPYNHHHQHHQHQQQQQLLQQQQQLQHQAISYGNVAQYYNQHHHENGSVQREEPMVIDSVPVVQGNKTAAKRLRLFGVNMECSTTTTKDESSSLYTKDYDSSQFSPSSRESRLSDKKGKSSLSFDLDL